MISYHTTWRSFVKAVSQLWEAAPDPPFAERYEQFCSHCGPPAVDEPQPRDVMSASVQRLWSLRRRIAIVRDILSAVGEITDARASNLPLRRTNNWNGLSLVSSIDLEVSSIHRNYGVLRE